MRLTSLLFALTSAVPFVAASIGVSDAATIYSYSGSVADERFGTPGVQWRYLCRRGQFTMSSPLGANFAFAEITPARFSFTDGDITVKETNAEPGFARFFASTDASGNIGEWAIESHRLTPFPTLEYVLQTINSVPSSALCTGGCIIDGLFAYDPGLDPELTGYAFDRDPGSWVVATPIPAALPLFLAAIASLAGLAASVACRRLTSRA